MRFIKIIVGFKYFNIFGYHLTKDKLMDSNHINSTKKQNLFIILSTLFLTNALIAEVIGAKILSFEKIFGLAPMALDFIGNTSLSLNMSVGVIIWPIVFILSDIINEYFGTSGVKRISYIGAGMIGYAFLLIFLAVKTPPADFWLKNNSVAGVFNAKKIRRKAYPIIPAPI